MPLSATEARDGFGETLNRVTYGKERVVVSRRGKPIAVLVPLEDLALLEQLEDEVDLDAARSALAESEERIPYDDVRRELGLR